MKTLTVAFALFANINLFAQESQTTNEPQTQDQNVQVQKTQPDCLAMKGNKVFLTENGITREITEEIWMRNGMQITPSGNLIFPNGEKAKLREGDVADLKGAVARPIPIGTETASK